MDKVFYRLDKQFGRILLVMIGLILVIYANTLNNGFVSDDIPAIVNNPKISHILSNGLNPCNLTNSLGYLIGKLNPAVYHLTNIILHSLNSILVFLFLRLFFRPWEAGWAVLIFAAHPVHTEAVSWISGRPYLFLSFFVLSSFLLYVSAVGSAKLNKLKYAASLGLYFFSLYSCIFALIFPGMLILYDLTFGLWRRNWKYWTAFLVLTGLKLWQMAGAIKQRVAEVSFDTGSSDLTNPLFNAVYSLFSHLGLLVWPAKLTFYHEPYSLSPAMLVIGVFSLLLIVLAMPFVFRRSRILFFAGGFFALFLAPTYSPVTISWLIAERYLYLPSMALSIFLAARLKKCSGGRKAKTTANLVMIFLLAACSLRTIIRNFDWKNHAAIWRATVKASPLSPKARNNMGDVHCGEGNLEKAVEQFKTAVELKPDYADAYHNLANTYQKMGRIEEAIRNYEKALSLNPRLYQSDTQLGIIYFNRGQRAQAEAYFQKAREIEK